MSATTTDGLATLHQEASRLRERLSAPVFTLGEANRLREEGVSLSDEHRRRKAPVRADAEAHNKRVVALARGLAPRAQSAQSRAEKTARIWGERAPETQRANRLWSEAFDAHGRALDAYVW